MQEKETVDIVFSGDFRQLDRLKFFLRKKLPHKIYFIRNIHNPNDAGQIEFKKELEKELAPWVAKNSTTVNVNTYSFEDCFTKLLRITNSEVKKGNVVNIALNMSSTIATTAVAMVAGLVDVKLFWVRPEIWKSIGNVLGDPRIMLPVGASKLDEVRIPLRPELPKAPYNHVLTFVFDNKDNVAGKLVTLAEKIGLEKISANVKKATSGAVKLSKIISRLREDGLVETKRTGRKSLEISLTEQGKLIAEVLKAME